MRDETIAQLVTANRILAHEGVVDAYGHVSVRHPDNPRRYLLSCSKSPELVTADDIMEFELDGTPAGGDGRRPYLERFIHGAVYERRPEIVSVVHNHAYEVIPFSVTSEPLRPLLHTAGRIGAEIPVWDIRDKFGDTDLLVTSMEHARDLAATLGGNACALMRGHGCVVAGISLQEAVMSALYLMVNARIQMDAMRLGAVTFLSDGEAELTAQANQPEVATKRVWEYLSKRARQR